VEERFGDGFKGRVGRRIRSVGSVRVRFADLFLIRFYQRSIVVGDFVIVLFPPSASRVARRDAIRIATRGQRVVNAVEGEEGEEGEGEDEVESGVGGGAIRGTGLIVGILGGKESDGPAKPH
jgi:hypothetical protein